MKTWVLIWALPISKQKRLRLILKMIFLTKQGYRPNMKTRLRCGACLWTTSSSLKKKFLNGGNVTSFYCSRFERILGFLEGFIFASLFCPPIRVFFYIVFLCDKWYYSIIVKILKDIICWISQKMKINLVLLLLLKLLF